MHSWYLARLRADAQARAEMQALTPLTVVQRDKSKLKTLIQRTSAAQAADRLKIVERVRGQKNFASHLANAQRLFDEQVKALSILLPALSESELTKRNEIPSLEEVASAVVHELEEARQGQRLIADCTPDLLCCLDPDSTILDTNVEFEQSTGYQRINLIGASVTSLLEEDDRSTFEVHLRKAKQDSFQSVENTLRCANKELIDLSWHIEWSHQSGCYFCQIRNVTERKRRQRLRAELTAMLSHDLQGPLTGVALALENVADGVYGDISPKGVKKLSVVQTSIEQMMQMIDQLLHAEKIDAGEVPLNIAPVESERIYANVRALTQAIAEQKQIELRLPSESKSVVRADLEHTTRVLSNLVFNAIKAAVSDSVVEVSEQPLAHSIRIAVRDQGPGVPEELRSSLFERYRSNRGGTGLGLYIAKKLVHLQSGEIGFESQAGSGSTFWFTLPRQVDNRDL